MIKKLQQLKAKKGFTLVELIVVIAIIGVLAAILVPTMMGFVTNSRVTSANSTAASFQDQIEQFLTDCDTKSYGMKQGVTATTEIEIVVDATGWKTTATNSTGATTAFNKQAAGSIEWGTSAVKACTTSDTAVEQAKCPENLLSIKLMSLFPDIKQAYIKAYAKAGHVEAVIYTADATSATAVGSIASAKYDTSTHKIEVKGVTNKMGGVDWEKKISGWDSQTAGISETGIIVGTAPALALGEPGAAPAATN